MPTDTKTCHVCDVEKELSQFGTALNRNGKIYHRNTCKKCRWERQKPIQQCHYQENKTKISLYNKTYRKKNKEKINKKKRQHYQTNKSSIAVCQKSYRRNNKNRINAINAKSKKKNKEKNNAKLREKRKSNPLYKLTENVRTLIKNSIRQNGGKSGEQSCLKYLDYTSIQLMEHLENLFEPWMNWNNHGKYDPKIWDDNDVSTWAWQIDHIKPRSEFSYFNAEDEEFKKCWALENLRPLSAKQNIIEGARQTRHNKVGK